MLADFLTHGLSALVIFTREVIVILTAIYLVSALVCFLTIYFTYKSQATYKKGMLFAVTLPEQAIEHEGIREVQSRFNRQFNRANLLVLLLFVPIAVLHAWPAYQTIYALLWFCSFFFVSVQPFRRAFRDTMALKREHEWFVGAKREIRSDLRVARLKNQRSAAPGWFAIPLAISVGLTLWIAQKDAAFLGVGIAGLILTVLFFVVSMGMRRTKTRVYSMDSEVNLSLNQARRRAWSYLWLFVSILENIHLILIYHLNANSGTEIQEVGTALLLLFAALPFGAIVYVHRKINALEQEVLSTDGKVVYSDDDEYWANGFTYHNPNDKSLLVPKRVGIGETINTGTFAGKLIVWGLAGVTAAIIVGTSFMLIRSELTSPTLTIASDSTVSIDYPMYSYDFNLTEVREVMLVDEVPKGTKTNGESTGSYARGHFRLKELGKTRLYVYKNNPPYIRIKLDNGYIFYNDEDPLRTRELYDQLRGLLKAD